MRDSDPIQSAPLEEPLRAARPVGVRRPREVPIAREPSLDVQATVSEDAGVSELTTGTEVERRSGLRAADKDRLNSDSTGGTAAIHADQELAAKVTHARPGGPGPISERNGGDPPVAAVDPQDGTFRSADADAADEDDLVGADAVRRHAPDAWPRAVKHLRELQRGTAVSQRQEQVEPRTRLSDGSRVAAVELL